jgi:hypothetical protein
LRRREKAHPVGKLHGEALDLRRQERDGLASRLIIAGLKKRSILRSCIRLSV